jgi:hypothetical protein
MRQLLWEGTVQSFVKPIFGVCVIVMLGLSAVQISPAAEVVLSDPLTSWPLNFGAQTDNMLLKDGAVHIVASATASSAWWKTYPGFSFTDMDATVTITANTATGNAAGLIFWSTGPSDFFLFTVSGTVGSFSLQRHISANGSWQILVPYTANGAVKNGVGAVNALRIVTKGNSAALTINGQSIGTLAVQAPAGGGTVGIEGEGQADNMPADYSYSNLSVSQ